MYVPEGEKTIRHAYKSKYNLTRENLVILLMIGDGEKWHYLTVRSLSALLKGITSKHKDYSCCLNCFHSYRSKEALEKNIKVCEDKDYCYIEMPKKVKSLKYHLGVESMNAPYTIVGDIESLLRKMDTWANDPSKSSTQNKNEHEMCRYSLFTDCSFDKKYNKLDYYRGKDSLKRFCQDLKKQARSIIDFEKKEMNLTPEEEFKNDMADKAIFAINHFIKIKKNNYIKVRDHCHYTGKYRGAAHKICNLMYNTQREIPVVFHNGSSYDYHFIITGLAEECEGDFEYLGEKKAKCITF